jgi:hypothetical protein
MKTQLKSIIIAAAVIFRHEIVEYLMLKYQLLEY